MTKVDAVRNKLTVLRLMEGREEAPKRRDTTELPGGGKLGMFWNNCKTQKKCGRLPYARLLTNPVLRADYRITVAARESDGKTKTNESES